MSAVVTSDVTQLLYRVTPNLNFAQVIGDLCAAFTRTDGKPADLAWDCDDIAVLDFDAARLVIGFSDNLPGPHAACLTIASGPSPLAGKPALARPDQVLLCNDVAIRLGIRFPSDAQQTQSLDAPLTPDLIDRVVDALFAQDFAAGTTFDEPVPQVAASATPAPPADADPGDMERLMRRLSSELTARTPSLISRAIASATPKGRGAASTAGASIGGTDTTAPKNLAASIARPDPGTMTTTIGGLFWRKAKSDTQRPDSANAHAAHVAVRRAPSSELKAVREALYAPDWARGTGVGRIAAQTKLALQTLAALPRGLADTVAARRHRDAPVAGDRVKH